MTYHSEEFITKISLFVNTRTRLKMAGVSSDQVQTGAVADATNEERKLFFLYSAMVISAFTAILTPLSTLLLILYLVVIGPNLGTVLCMPFWITIFVTLTLDEKARECNQNRYQVSFSRGDLLLSICKAGILGVILMSLILWITS